MAKTPKKPVAKGVEKGAVKEAPVKPRATEPVEPRAAAKADANRAWGLRLLVILLLVFAVVLGINFAMVWFAVSTNTGVVSKNAYEEGLAYNKTLAEQAKEAGLGWSVVRNVADFPVKLVYALSGPDGKPLGSAWVHVKVSRPMNDVAPFEVDLREDTDGTYAADMQWPQKGVWELETTFVHDGKTLVARERVNVQ